MDLIISKNSFLVFDLDDTLYKEIDFLKSAYKHIAFILEEEIGDYIYEEMFELYQSGEVVFDVIKEKYKFEMSIKDIVSEYRYHGPMINMDDATESFLTILKHHKVKMGIITDGRSESQRNKLNSLGILEWFEDIIISEEFGSEKPSIENFKHYESKFEGFSFYYFGDNFTKDFVSPNKLGWQTIGLLDQGENIHKQYHDLGEEYLPKHEINSFSEINLKFENP